MAKRSCILVKPFPQRTRRFFGLSDGLPGLRILCLAIDNGGRIYAGTENGLAVYDGKAFRTVDTGEAGAFYMLFCDSDGVVFAACGEKLYSVVDGKATFAGSFGHPVVQMDYDGDGTLWMLTNKSLYRRVDGKFVLYSDEIEGGCCTCMAAFGSAQMYIVNDLLLLSLHGKRPRFAGISTYNSDKPTNYINTLAADKWGHVWIGTDEGVCLYDAKSRWRTWENTEYLPEGDIRKIVLGADGTRYFGTADGLIIQSGVNESYLSGKRWLPSNEVTSIAASADGTVICVGTAEGLSVIEVRYMTLEQKADIYGKNAEKYNIREGFVSSRRLSDPLDYSSGAVEISDNDGLRTAHFVVAQSFRYAVTGSEEALSLARASLKAMLKLTTITGIEGFTARAIRRPGEEGYGNGHIECHPAKDETGELEWKGETSSDEMTGHFYAYSYYYDLCADDEEKVGIAAACSKIIDHILSHDGYLCDVDGLPTTWANWNPDDINYNARLVWERGVNSLEFLSFLLTTYHVTGDEKYRAVYERFVTKHGYAFNCVQHKVNDCHVCHIDDQLGFLATVPLLRYENDPELRQLYLLGLRHFWQSQRIERTPMWNIIYGALTGDFCDIENAVRSLQELPLDMFDYKVKNSNRRKLKWSCGQEAFGGGPQLMEPLPADERALGRLACNPFEPDGGREVLLHDGCQYLHPYWMGRYYGLFEE